MLLERAKGKYVIFIDDDDKVSEDYLYEILEAIKQEPDVISFNGWVETNGANRESFKISKDLPYITIQDAFGKREHLRYPNHIVPVKREIALLIGFRDMRFAEDFDYAKRLKESGLLKKEVYIQKDLYFYLYDSKKNNLK
jgi:GT2 family glycosyltransferase